MITLHFQLKVWSVWEAVRRINIEILGLWELMWILEPLKNQSESWKSPGHLFLKKGTNPVGIGVLEPHCAATQPHAGSYELTIKPIDACAARNRPWRTSSLLTKIGIIYTQLLQEEEIFPMMPRSEWSAQWSLIYAQKCSKSWVKNSEQNFLPLHLDAPC